MNKRVGAVLILVMLTLLGSVSTAHADAPYRDLARSKAKPVTRHSLQSVLVPALRDNRAGRLRHGNLPHPGAGFTKLYTQGGARPAFGNLTRDRVRDAAAVLLSTAGAGGSDQYVALYTNGNKRLLGYFDPAGAAYTMDSEVYHAYVTRMRIVKRTVRINFTTDNWCGGPMMSWRAKLRWNGHRVVARVVPVGEPQAAC